MCGVLGFFRKKSSSVASWERGRVPNRDGVRRTLTVKAQSVKILVWMFSPKQGSEHGAPPRSPAVCAGRWQGAPLSLIIGNGCRSPLALLLASWNCVSVRLCQGLRFKKWSRSYMPAPPTASHCAASNAHTPSWCASSSERWVARLVLASQAPGRSRPLTASDERQRTCRRN